MDVNYISSLVTILLGILVFLGYVTGFFKWCVKKIKSIYKILNKKNKKIVIHLENSQFPELSNWWHMGAIRSNPAMQVVAELLATNNTDKQIILTGSLLRKRKIRGQVLTKAVNGRVYSTENPIPPGTTTKISLNFWVEPPFKKEGVDFVSDIAVIDNYGEKHWVPKVKFKYN
ncbi:hypothetical protein [Legionella israelensis]|uniref:Uncharacterized protein n=1 Tax=Legionella israelensis TaxID=454 RepID=A0A0W0V3I1_9GAMM|nr:hypothetical protein [Legionella israelensis]KTD14390.1 hypothetical protein Lisr_2618 [Legionella israelensis]QBS09970.1 hypothetical protein E4T55_08955 [Legionella israelensis]SCY52548.1 hypothetical protein SAMN02746069_02750 [Legionella israelensis DSM 19235]STX59542.1 Uncharacterised protein [Legionella israelensis]